MVTLGKKRNSLIILWTNKTISFHYNGRSHSAIEIEDDDDLSVFFKRACEIIEFKGKSARIYYEGSHVEHATVECPSLDKDSDVELFLDQNMSRGKVDHPFNECVYIYEKTSTKRKSSLIVDIFDKYFVNNVIDSLASIKIHVDLFSSTLPLLKSLCKEVNHKDSPTIILGAINNASAVVYLYYDYEFNSVVMCRNTPPFIEKETPNEINRSVQFGKHVFSGLSPNVVSVGDYFNDIDISLEGVDYYQYGGDDAILKSSASYNIDSTMNLIPPSRRNIHTKRAYRRVIYLTVFVFFILSFSANYIFNNAVVDFDNNLKTERQLSDSKKSIEQDISKLNEIKAKNSKMLMANNYNVYKLVRGILNGIDTESFVLDNLSANEKGGKVHFYIKGKVFVNPKEGAEILSKFQSMLINDYGAVITSSWKSRWLSSIEVWRNSFYNKDRTSTTSIPFSLVFYIDEKRNT